MSARALTMVVAWLAMALPTLAQVNPPYSAFANKSFQTGGNVIYQRGSVERYGAKGDGVTDDTASVQAAINAVDALPNGGFVYFPNGRYSISTLTVTNARVSFVGDNWFGSALLKRSDSTNHLLIVKSEGFSCTGLRFEAPTAFTATGCLMFIDSVSDPRVESCWFTGGYKSIFANKVSNLQLRNNIFEASQTAEAYLYQCATATIVGNVFFAADLVDGGDAAHSYGTIQMESDPAYSFPGNMTTITGNYFNYSRYSHSIKAVNVTDTTITANFFHLSGMYNPNAKDDVYLAGCTNATVTANTSAERYNNYIPGSRATRYCVSIDALCKGVKVHANAFEPGMSGTVLNLASDTEYILDNAANLLGSMTLGDYLQATRIRAVPTFSYAVQERGHIHETAAVNAQLHLSNAGTYNTGLVMTDTDYDNDATGVRIGAGASVYHSGLANSAFVALADSVPEFRVVALNGGTAFGFLRTLFSVTNPTGNATVYGTFTTGDEAVSGRGAATINGLLTVNNNSTAINLSPFTGNGPNYITWTDSIGGSARYYMGMSGATTFVMNNNHGGGTTLTDTGGFTVNQGAAGSSHFLNTAAGTPSFDIGPGWIVVQANSDATTKGVFINNDTAATVGVQQSSPVLVLAGQGWSTGSSASQPVVARVQNVVASGASPSSTFKLQTSVNGGAFSDNLTVSSAGATTAGTFTATTAGTSDFGGGINTLSANVTNNVTVGGSVTATNGFIHQFKGSFATNFTCVSTQSFYLLNGTNQLITLPTAASTAGRIFRFSMTNGLGSFVVTNAADGAKVRDGVSLSYTNIGINEVGFLSDGSNWWLASKGKQIFPSASWSLTNTISPVQDVITNLPFTTLEFNNSQGIALRTKAGFTGATELAITNAGTYMITFSAVLKGSAGGSKLSIWLRKDGSDVPRTRTDQGFSGATAQQCMTVNYFVNVDTSPHYFELCAASHDATPPTIESAAANPTGYTAPAMPGIIVTINRVSDTWP